jgi:hypothetical integral membrane protein (TIGR02206 family)
MGRYLFTTKEHIPDGLGFRHFGLQHIMILVLIAILIVLFSGWYKRMDETRRRRSRFVIAILVVGLEVLKDLLVIADEVYSWEYLPLHLCGMTIFFIFIHSFWPNRFTAEFLYCLSIPGAISALLFADWTMLPFANFFCIHSFFIHMLEITYPVMLLRAGEIRPDIRNIWRPAIYIVVAAFVIYHLNHLLNTNFFFINEAAPGSPFALFESFMGSPGYIFGGGLLLLLIWVLMYIPFLVKGRGKARHMLQTETKPERENT